MNSVITALKLQEQCRKKKAFASTDQFKRHFSLGEASTLVEQAAMILIPFKSLITGLRAASLLCPITCCLEAGKDAQAALFTESFINWQRCQQFILTGLHLRSKMFVFNPTTHIFCEELVWHLKRVIPKLQDLA